MLLTVFGRPRQYELRQIDRAVRAQKICGQHHRDPATGTYERQGVMTGYPTRRVRPAELAEDPGRIAIREALAFAMTTGAMPHGWLRTSMAAY